MIMFVWNTLAQEIVKMCVQRIIGNLGYAKRARFGNKKTLNFSVLAACFRGHLWFMFSKIHFPNKFHSLNVALALQMCLGQKYQIFHTFRALGIPKVENNSLKNSRLIAKIFSKSHLKSRSCHFYVNCDADAPGYSAAHVRICMRHPSRPIKKHAVSNWTIGLVAVFCLANRVARNALNKIQSCQ